MAGYQDREPNHAKPGRAAARAWIEIITKHPEVEIEMREDPRCEGLVIALDWLLKVGQP